MNDSMIVKILNRFAASNAVLYGVWIWWFDSFDRSNAFSLYASAPEAAFSIPLILGAFLQLAGERRKSAVMGFVGLLCSVAVFAAATMSCFRMALHSTGVPAYASLLCFYAALAFCTALRSTTSNVGTHR